MTSTRSQTLMTLASAISACGWLPESLAERGRRSEDQRDEPEHEPMA